jgi:adenylate cyclase
VKISAVGTERDELVEYLVSLGATSEDLEAYRDELPGLASVLAIRGGPGLTLEEVADRSGLPVEKVRRINRATGFPDPGPDDRVFTEGSAALAANMAAAEALFGEEVVFQLLRVMGASLARIADAIVSAFLVNVEAAVRTTGERVELNVARANAEAAELLPFVAESMDQLLRRHLVAARRTLLGEEEPGYEVQRLCVGFVDLVGSTALSERLSTEDLGALLTEFENIASDTVTAGGGRVVKLIGDEVLFSARSERSACRVALELTRQFADHPRLPAVRAGLASGDVLLRDGDVFGPVVNLAARAVALAGASELVMPPALAETAGLPAESLGPQALKGFEGGVELCRVTRGTVPLE